MPLCYTEYEYLFESQYIYIYIHFLLNLIVNKFICKVSVFHDILQEFKKGRSIFISGRHNPKSTLHFKYQ